MITIPPSEFNMRHQSYSHRFLYRSYHSAIPFTLLALTSGTVRAFLSSSCFLAQTSHYHVSSFMTSTIPTVPPSTRPNYTTTTSAAAAVASSFSSSSLSSSSSSALFMGKPKSGSVVDSYQTVSVNCKKCKTKLFRYKKKNGTKSNLIKCYVERISEDCQNIVAEKQRQVDGGSNSNDEYDDEYDDDATTNNSSDWICPNCGTKFGRDALIHGRAAIKLVGGKTQMTKK